VPLATAEADAHSLVSAARDLIHIDEPQTAGLWPRAAALLGRQAIEAAMADLWRLSAPGLEDTSAKCQLLCLSHFLGDPAHRRRARGLAGDRVGPGRSRPPHPPEGRQLVSTRRQAPAGQEGGVVFTATVRGRPPSRP
jgi:hypothetical protein